MANEKHYDYYITSKEVKEEKLKEHAEKFGDKRKNAIKEMCDKYGAIAYTTRNSWGNGEYVSELIFEAEHDFLDPSKFKLRPVEFDNKSCFAVSGKGNRKQGIAFNKDINALNKELRDIPNFTDWVVEDFGVMRTGFGEPAPSGHGMYMLETKGGVVGDFLGFMIPNNMEEKHGKIKIPECFEKITYGKWYDLTNAS